MSSSKENRAAQAGEIVSQYEKLLVPYGKLWEILVDFYDNTIKIEYGEVKSENINIFIRGITDLSPKEFLGIGSYPHNERITHALNRIEKSISFALEDDFKQRIKMHKDFLGTALKVRDEIVSEGVKSPEKQPPSKRRVSRKEKMKMLPYIIIFAIVVIITIVIIFVLAMGGSANNGNTGNTGNTGIGPNADYAPNGFVVHTSAY
jgi:hypothetical protein